MAYFELALRLGSPHPDHLLRQLTSAQVTEWLAFLTIRNRPPEDVGEGPREINDPNEKTAALKSLLFPPRK